MFFINSFTTKIINYNYLYINKNIDLNIYSRRAIASVVRIAYFHEAVSQRERQACKCLSQTGETSFPP